MYSMIVKIMVFSSQRRGAVITLPSNGPTAAYFDKCRSIELQVKEYGICLVAIADLRPILDFILHICV